MLQFRGFISLQTAQAQWETNEYENYNFIYKEESCEHGEFFIHCHVVKNY